MKVELKLRNDDDTITTYSINDVDYVKVIKFGSLIEIVTTTNEPELNLISNSGNIVDKYGTDATEYQYFGKYVYIEDSKIFIVRSIIDELYIYNDDE